MKVVHILDGRLPTHYNKIISYMKSLNEITEFIVIDGEEKDLCKSIDTSVMFMSFGRFLILFMKSSNECRFILHGNFFKLILINALLNMIHFKKITNLFWVCWGSGVSNNINSFTLKALRAFSYRKLGAAHFLMGPDKINFLKIVGDRWKGKISVSPYYNEQFETEFMHESLVKHKDDYLHVFLGNQSTPHHNHKEMIDKLYESDKDKNIFLHLLMSYGTGTLEYIEEIKNVAINKFPNRYCIYRNILDYESYLKLLSKSDVVIVDTKHQTGLGLIYNAVNNGAVIFLNKDGSNYRWLCDLGLRVSTTEEISYENILNRSFSCENRKALADFFDKKNVDKYWKSFIYDEI
ncbi:TDP-N-acetylfucosamine:lipid II N-acetylfucosaminyltransferase [Vibrio navarrensis]|uniref:4-alpha-L-fucosyltransferase n=1 Tax=Vibrio navarrensis TaxID=29495 RepID=A0A099LRP7_9VIBR|nr:TDP-N-acetylfucosamine:lipid II N-acetylfucosaminyltransferase [Vibrio navarrensis]KGK10166.1 hypothetical protein EA26_02085 [Vibrio navarrensis]MBE4590006.1 hypothetical protein [Vibrio navarrensis]MBE4616477.1 hypothetical protein [Vibrio navarrensis]QOD69856.1 TDP-N-acetylfucosamine:lipid II N-acetylfucosaminyltransferase [Vibrio navarrensis]